MPRAEIFTTIIKCKKCKFHATIEGTKENSKIALNSIINNHNVNSDTTKEDRCIAREYNDFIIDTKKQESKYKLEVKNIIESRLEETKELINVIKTKNETIKNTSYIDNIKLPFINYVNDKDYHYTGLVLIRDITDPSQNVINIVINIITATEEYSKDFDLLVMNYDDFISKPATDSVNKIQFMMNKLSLLNQESSKGILLIINNIDNLISDRNTRSDSERMTMLIDEFEKIYDDHSMYIICIASHIKRVEFLNKRFEIAKFK